MKTVYCFPKAQSIVVLCFCVVALQTGAFAQRSATLVGGGCEGCEGLFEGLPRVLDWQTTIAPQGGTAQQVSTPGEALELRGVIYRKDGVTPAPGVILYVYHTNAQGYYASKSASAGVWARRHGDWRGWMKTNAKGEYRFRTIKPAPYPNARIPAHIHPTIKEDGINEYYIDEFEFDDDPMLTTSERAKRPKRGGSGIITLTKGTDGVWHGKRDIVLGRNIPNYPAGR